MPGIPLQNYAVMRHRYVMAIYSIGMLFGSWRGPGFKVDHKLVTKQVKICPLIAAAAFGAAQYLAVKAAGLLLNHKPVWLRGTG